MTAGELYPSGFDDPDPEPVDPNALPIVELHHPDEDPPRRTIATRWFVIAAAAIVVVGGVLGVLLFNSSAPEPSRGAASPTAAATRFVEALNASDEAAAAAISCSGFADQARSAARSAADPAFRYTLGAVRRGGKNSATALMIEHLTLPGSTQDRPATLSVRRGGGRWLVCGRAS